MAVAIRVTDALVLNAAVNHPSVLPAVAPGYESFDLAEFLRDKRNIALKYVDAVGIFRHVTGDVYEAHYLFPSTVRGPCAKKAAKEMLRQMFTTYAAAAIRGNISREHRAARLMTRALGFTPLGRGRDASGHECVQYVLKREEWAKSSD